MYKAPSTMYNAIPCHTLLSRAFGESISNYFVHSKASLNVHSYSFAPDGLRNFPFHKTTKKEDFNNTS